MHAATKLTLPMAFVSLVLGACSSSGGASFDLGQTVGIDHTTDTVDEVTDAMDESTDTSTVTSGFVPTEIIGAGEVDMLQGQWEAVCDQVAPSLFQTSELSVVGPRLIYNFSLFSDQECTIPTAVNTVLSGSTIQQEGTTVPTGETVDVSIGTAVAVDFHFEQATVDNRPIPEENFLGKETLEAFIDYDIVFSQDGNLYLGDSSIEGFDGSAPETRPTTLNFNTQYVRVQ